MSELLLCSILLLAPAEPEPKPPEPAAEVTFDIGDVVCWRRLMRGRSCGARAPTEMLGPLFPGVRSDLADIPADPEGKQK